MGWVIFRYEPRVANRNLPPPLSFSVTDFGTQNGQ
jgi:hypothetical protein